MSLPKLNMGVNLALLTVDTLLLPHLRHLHNRMHVQHLPVPRAAGRARGDAR